MLWKALRSLAIAEHVIPKRASIVSACPTGDKFYFFERRVGWSFGRVEYHTDLSKTSYVLSPTSRFLAVHVPYSVPRLLLWWSDNNRAVHFAADGVAEPCSSVFLEHVELQQLNSK